MTMYTCVRCDATFNNANRHESTIIKKGNYVCDQCNARLDSAHAMLAKYAKLLRHRLGIFSKRSSLDDEVLVPDKVMYDMRLLVARIRYDNAVHE